MRAKLNNRAFPDGTGRNKKEAKQIAAKNALSCLEKEEPVDSANDNSSEKFLHFSQANYICWLNEYAQKHRLFFEAKQRTKMSINTQFCLYACKYACGDKEFPEAEGKDRKEAKDAAAKLVYDDLYKEWKTKGLDEISNDTQIPKITSPSSALSCLMLNSPANTESNTEGNFKGMLNHYCQKSKQAIDFKLVEKRGPAHNPEFVYKVVINKKEYPEGLGKTIKDAQQHAAQLAWSELQEQFAMDSQTSVVSMVSKEDSTVQIPKIDLEDVSLSTSESIAFKDPSVHLQNINKSVPKPSPSEVKSKRILAANFCFSPNSSTKEGPNINVCSSPTKETQASYSSAKSRFLEDFHSVSRVGKGGFGCVFKARRKLDQKYYAVKIVKYTEKALREVEALANLAHTNIVRYYTSWIEETAYRCESSESYSTSNSSSGLASKFLYIQMELCEGETLRVWIDKNNAHFKQSSKRRQEAARIMKQVLEAVKYVHCKKLIHRDLKPPNIMFGNDGGVKVGDFGLVTAAEVDNDEGLLERTKHTGTHSYMSPEQRSKDSYDKKVDVFALGLIYFELLWCLGTVNEKQKIWEGLRSKVFPQQFDARFDFEHKLIEKMLCINPEERPDTKELLTELEKCSTVLWMDHNANKEAHTY